ncbi:MAG: glutamate 5-kinase [Oscillospiraceae bacterium]|jgi:glutamate 5-kinase|nr:glutamate 5-kinase [Oscillospiraceae bacterium]
MRDYSKAGRIVIKVGTSTLTYESGHINIRRFEKLVKVLSDLANSGREIILVSSGAMGVGMGKLGIKARPLETPARQAIAAVGQLELMHQYDQAFLRFNRNTAQVLLTRDVVERPALRENATNTLCELLSLGVVPIVNENDTVATDELEGENFGDNDTLSAIVATLVEADILILLSDIDGLYTQNPHDNPDAKLIPLVESVDGFIEQMASGSHSNRGTGGMATKIHAAKTAAAAGIDMAIINGSDPALLYDLLEGKQVGTIFIGSGGSQ